MEKVIINQDVSQALQVAISALIRAEATTEVDMNQDWWSDELRRIMAEEVKQFQDARAILNQWIISKTRVVLELKERNDG